MNSKKLSEAISEVNDKYYEEAANYQPKTKKAAMGKMGGNCRLFVPCDCRKFSCTTHT